MGFWEIAAKVGSEAAKMMSKNAERVVREYGDQLSEEQVDKYSRGADGLNSLAQKADDWVNSREYDN